MIQQDTLRGMMHSITQVEQDTWKDSDNTGNTGRMEGSARDTRWM